MLIDRDTRQMNNLMAEIARDHHRSARHRPRLLSQWDGFGGRA